MKSSGCGCGMLDKKGEELQLAMQEFLIDLFKSDGMIGIKQQEAGVPGYSLSLYWWEDGSQ